MFIQTQETPNPNSLKFVLSREICSEPMFFKDKNDPYNPIIVIKLLNIEGVEAVFFGYDFISVTKSDNILWEILKPDILFEMVEHESAGLDFLAKNSSNNGDISSKNNSAEDDENDDEIIRQIKAVIEEFIRPNVMLDGGDIIFHSFNHETGVLKLELQGACAGCPSSSITLKNGVETMMMHYVPEVVTIETTDAN